MKQLLTIILTGATLLALNSCRENETLTENNEAAFEQNSLLKKGDSLTAREFKEKDPPKDRDNWRMSPQQ
ncbi:MULTISPECIES: hypothetical protein [Chryseobacterium]|jgi:hypothetical protein|uniref:Uncharacterized protein n=2 Tax=Chryseobacterium gleum TaxID=250 RepID=A0A448B034_CHRGE|nr:MULTISPECIES: hypothetical protein [Chryseobacterium]PZU14093.1 MAG: hypothetical protein DI622_13665 [Chryseobacterium sp.]ASE61657.1 hypothetical protein CEQ15_09200 [Chryseobacterium indologenes]AZB32283.1 hypothetical protein EG351_00605 [Chryseobacterium bernardetii]EFK33964.1 hypothetical protein HMPREF0204_13033 [Chryseobacterium gleum ATCC 35910]MDG4654165.1 hypothetical protein [Chryseobacterium arthrosphaerae]